MTLLAIAVFFIALVPFIGGGFIAFGIVSSVATVRAIATLIVCSQVVLWLAHVMRVEP